jgi:integrase
MPRRPELQATESSNGWMISIPPTMTATGKRERKFFGDDKRAAERFAAGLRRRYDLGQRGTLLDPVTAIAAAEAVKILAPLGVSLVEAARTIEAQWKARGSDETFRERWLRYLRQHEGNWRPVYALQMAKLDRWVGEALMDTRLHALTDEVILAALVANGSKSKGTLKRRLAMVKSVISERGKERRAVKIEIMTVGQCAKMLRACEDDAERRAVALLLFAGIRPDVDYGEITRLDWSAVGKKEIYIAHEVSKTGTDRHIPITPRLKRLLRGHPGHGPVTPAGWKRKCDRLRKAAGIAGKSDITRHTFASHCLAAYGEQVTKAAMGHTKGSDTLFRHYRRSVTEEAGRKYFSER